MSSELIKYVAEQSGGVLIAIILINHVESKLDLLTNEITRLIDTLSAQIVPAPKATTANDTRQIYRSAPRQQHDRVN